jgi:hypothetical protein
LHHLSQASCSDCESALTGLDFAELEDILSATCQTHELIDNVLRSYLAFTTNFKGIHSPRLDAPHCDQSTVTHEENLLTGKGEYLQSDYDVARCCYKLLESALFKAHQDYVRRQVVYGLLQVRTSPALASGLSMLTLFSP